MWSLSILYSYCAILLEVNGYNENIWTNRFKKTFKNGTTLQFRDKVHELCKLGKNTMKIYNDNDDIVEVLNNRKENDNKIEMYDKKINPRNQDINNE